MRPILITLVLFSTLGCRPPSIPPQTSPSEYEVYSGWIEQTSIQFPRQLSFAIDSSTLTPEQNELQYRQCLPRRMESIFDSAPEATLTATSSNDWISLSDGRQASLHPHESPAVFAQPTEFFRLSRVAFTRFGYDAWFWVEHQTCDPNSPCADRAGTLVHAKKSNNAWRFEATVCQTLVFPS